MAAQSRTRAQRRWRALAMVGTALVAALGGACASTGAVPRPFPGASVPSPAPRSAEPARGAEVAVVATALDLRGVRYRNGGSDPTGFDCSGFTQYVFANHGVTLPREVRDQFATGRGVNPRNLRPGDLVFFSTTERGATHVGIAIGGTEFVHAPSSTGVVRVESLSGRYWSDRLMGARRVL